MIMSNIGGASEIVDDGRNGFLFRVGDTAAFVDRLNRAAEPALRSRMASEALRQVREHFDDAAMIGRYADLFHRLVEARSGSRTPS
jgi:glycosyltransferase involved in cell wall biosynthesis